MLAVRRPSAIRPLARSSGLFVVRTSAPVAERWYSCAPRVMVGGTVFYLHSRLDVYFGGFALSVDLHDHPPSGYQYLHPGTGKRFKTVSAFRSWHAQHPAEARALLLRSERGRI